MLPRPAVEFPGRIRSVTPAAYVSDRSGDGINLCSIAGKGDILFFILCKRFGGWNAEEQNGIVKFLAAGNKRLKMEFLKKRLAEAKDSKARAAIAQKILKINPQANVSPK